MCSVVLCRSSTSVKDGATYTMNATAITEWQNNPPFFNGETVYVELLAFPNTGDNRVAIDTILEAIPEPFVELSV